MNKRLAGLGLPLFILLPLSGFLFSLFDFKSKKSAFIYVAFSILYGYSISFSETGADSYRYALAFANFDNSLNYDRIITLYQLGELRDLYRLILFYLTSIFTSNPKVMYALAGGIYGFLSYLNLRILLNQKKQSSDKYIFLLILIFFTFVSLSNINGFRFWTGAMLLFYSSYHFILKKKNFWVFGVLVTPLFHYGFMPVMPLIIIYKFFLHPFLYNESGVSPILYYLFITSFIISWVLSTNSIDIGFIKDNDVFSGEVANRIEFLNSERATSIVKSRVESSLFLSVQKYFNIFIKIYVFIAVLFLKNRILKIKGNKLEYNTILAFVMFFYSFAFIATSFPSGARFLNIAHLFLMLLMVIMYVKYSNRNFKKIISWSLPVFSFNILFTNGMLSWLILTPTFWYGNFFWIIIEGLDFII
ncbi:MAG: hypothetical protein RI980_1852 [Bacteroidota bacterium]|jgi:hypothetical protein|nr:MAG: hypothetical protein EAY77_03790 [Flavobacteriia bacterium]